MEPNIFPQSEWFSDVLLISVLSLTGTYKGRAGCSCPLSSRLCAAWEQGLGLPQQNNRPVEQPQERLAALGAGYLRQVFWTGRALCESGTLKEMKDGARGAPTLKSNSLTPT